MTTPNPTSAVNPSQASVDALAATPDPGPIAMLNLLRYDGDTGRATYGRYAQVAAATIAAVGGSLIYLGQTLEEGVWDSVALIWYPNRAAYLQMQHDERYVAAIPDRTAGLAARLLYPFALPAITGAEAAARAAEGTGETTVFQLASHGDTPVLIGGTPIMTLPAGGPGLVSDDLWTELRIDRFTGPPPASSPMSDGSNRTAQMIIATNQTELPRTAT